MGLVITNFGDSNTTGNVVLQQNLTVQGSSTTFYGNVLAGYPSTSLANVASPFACVYVSTMNTLVANITSVWGLAGFTGVGTSVPSGTTLYVQGNVAVSNALSTPNVFSTLVNTQVLNVTSIYGPAGYTGVGTSVPSGTTLYVQGNAYVTNALTTPNVFSAQANVTSMNVQTLIFTQSLGVGTTPGLANLSVNGWINVTNSIVTTNVYASTANVTTLNVQSIFGQSGSVGVGTTAGGALFGTTLYVQGNVWASNSLVAPNILSNVSNTTLANVATLLVQGLTGLGGALASGPTLNVLGNVTVSNALVVSNLVSNLANVVGANVSTLLVQGLTGLGGALASGPTLNVLGNVTVSNALVVANLVANVANLAGANLQTVTVPGNLAVGGALASGPTLNVLGNVLVSNALTVTNIFVTGTLNVASGQANVTSFVAVQAGLGGALPSGPTLNILGNVTVSNALVTSNLVATLANIQTLNAQSLSFAFPLNVGIGTTAGASNLTVAGNVYVTNAVTSQNIFTGTLYYGEDLFKRGPYLLPSGANAATIQNWVSGTCNAASQPARSWWATSPAPSFGNVASGPKGQSDYWGGVYLADGRVLFVPQNASNVGFFNPATGLFSSVPLGASSGFRGGVLVPSGNVVFVPWTSANALVYNPLSAAFANVPCGGAFQGGTLLPSGNVAFFTKTSGNIGVLNPSTLTFSNVGPLGPFGGAGTLLPTGNLVMCPSGTTGNIGVWNSSAVSWPLGPGTFTNIGPVPANECGSAVLTPQGNVVFLPSGPGANLITWNQSLTSPWPLTSPGTCTNVACGAALLGGALLPSGNVVTTGPVGSNVGMFDPGVLTFSNLARTGTGGYAGATLVPDGRVVLCPSAASNVGVLDTQVPVDPAWSLSPLFNKF